MTDPEPQRIGDLPDDESVQRPTITAETLLDFAWRRARREFEKARGQAATCFAHDPVGRAEEFARIDRAEAQERERICRIAYGEDEPTRIDQAERTEADRTERPRLREGGAPAARRAYPNERTLRNQELQNWVREQVAAAKSEGKTLEYEALRKSEFVEDWVQDADIQDDRIRRLIKGAVPGYFKPKPGRKRHKLD